LSVETAHLFKSDVQSVPHSHGHIYAVDHVIDSLLLRYNTGVIRTYVEQPPVIAIQQFILHNTCILEEEEEEEEEEEIYLAQRNRNEYDNMQH